MWKDPAHSAFCVGMTGIETPDCQGSENQNPYRRQRGCTREEEFRSHAAAGIHVQDEEMVDIPPTSRTFVTPNILPCLDLGIHPDLSYLKALKRLKPVDILSKRTRAPSTVTVKAESLVANLRHSAHAPQDQEVGKHLCSRIQKDRFRV